LRQSINWIRTTTQHELENFARQLTQPDNQQDDTRNMYLVADFSDEAILSTPERTRFFAVDSHHLFTHPIYWAAFVAFGA
jgi:CHAT domain-containing protein